MTSSVVMLNGTDVANKRNVIFKMDFVDIQKRAASGSTQTPMATLHKVKKVRKKKNLVKYKAVRMIRMILQFNVLATSGSIFTSLTS